MAASDAPVLILTGPPGAGKTTAARALARRWKRAVHLESDYFFRFVASGYVEPWLPESHDQNTTIMRIVADAAAAYSAAGYFTIVDGIVLPSSFLAPLRDDLQAAGQTVAYAVLRAPLATCSARAASRDTQPRADPSVVRSLWSRFAELGPLERHAIDLGSEPPAAVADLLEVRLRDGSLRT